MKTKKSTFFFYARMCFGIIFGMILPNFSKAETLNALNDIFSNIFSSYSSIEDVDPQLLPAHKPVS
jgi:Na+/H+-dicarboxylate symporter